MQRPHVTAFLTTAVATTLVLAIPSPGPAAPPITARPGLFKPLTEPPCSYCSTQHLKGLIKNDDLVVAWIRGRHNGGAIPLRHFLAGPRVINDTYGLFFYDPDGGYVAAFRKDYGYSFHGWRRGVMVVKGPNGSLWSALTGKAFAGPNQGQRLKRVPSMVSHWSYWLMLHPESTAYNLFNGKRYPIVALPNAMHPDAKASIGKVDKRLATLRGVIGIETTKSARAYPLDPKIPRACFTDTVDGQPIAVFWYAKPATAVAFSATLDGRPLTFYADNGSPETAPIKDRETGTRWTMAGRGVDGRLRGKELKWVPSIQCRWYAWSSEFPRTEVYAPAKPASRTAR